MHPNCVSSLRIPEFTFLMDTSAVTYLNPKDQNLALRQTRGKKLPHAQVFVSTF